VNKFFKRSHNDWREYFYPDEPEFLSYVRAVLAVDKIKQDNFSSKDMFKKELLTVLKKIQQITNTPNRDISKDIESISNGRRREEVYEEMINILTEEYQNLVQARKTAYDSIAQEISGNLFY